MTALKPMKTIVLRDYQYDKFFTQINRYLRHNPSVLLRGPTGCGKTKITQALIGANTGTDLMTHAVVLAPQVQIEDGFYPPEEGLQIVFPSSSEDGVTIMPPVEIRRAQEGVTRGGWKKLREDDKSNSRNNALDTYLRDSKPAYDCVLTTHSTFYRWAQNFDCDYDLKGRVMFVDEAHHAGDDTEVGRGLQKWLDMNGKIVYITATSFRTDGNGMYDKAVPVIRTMAEHSIGGIYAPRDFKLDNHKLSMVAQNFKQVKGDECPLDTGHAAEELVAKWIADGRPKTVVNVPAIGSEKWALDLELAFRKARAKGVFNAVGYDKIFNTKEGKWQERQDVLMELLQEERKVKDYKDKDETKRSQVDVILACKRFNEGTDWPLCSHVYNIGTPSSLQLIIQRWGRATRVKTDIANYPKKHRNVAYMTFFPLRLSDELWENYSKYQLRQTCLLSAFMANQETAQKFTSWRWRPEDIGRERIGKRLSFLKEVGEDAENALNDMDSPDTARKASVDAIPLVEKYQQATGIKPPTDGDLIEYAKKMGTDEDTLQGLSDRVVSLAINNMDEDTHQKLMTSVVNEVAPEGADYSPTPATFDLIKKTFHRKIFEDVAFKHSYLVAGCAETLKFSSKFTGRECESIAHDLAQGLKPLPSRDQAKAALIKYFDSLEALKYFNDNPTAVSPPGSADASEWCGLPTGSVTFAELKDILESNLTAEVE